MEDDILGIASIEFLVVVVGSAEDDEDDTLTPSNALLNVARVMSIVHWNAILLILMIVGAVVVVIFLLVVVVLSLSCGMAFLWLSY